MSASRFPETLDELQAAGGDMAYEYECDQCGGTFTAEWSEEEALAEFRETFGREKREDDAEVCDDCYKAAMAAHAGQDHAANAASFDELRAAFDRYVLHGLIHGFFDDPKFKAELERMAKDRTTPPDSPPGTVPPR